MAYYLHQLKRTGETVEKGIVVKDTFDAALQSYHAYMGAYAYGMKPSSATASADFVHCIITDESGTLPLINDSWTKKPAEVIPEENNE